MDTLICRYIVNELGGIVRALAPIIACCLFVGCSEECDIILVRDYLSPDGQRVATVYGYTCYNTTGHDKYVDLRRAGKKLRHPGNVTRVGPGDTVSISWSSPTQLVVSYHYEVPRSGPAITNIDGVTIVFREAPELRGVAQ